MRWLSKLFTTSKKVPSRSRIDGATVEGLLSLKLRDRKRANYRHLPTKGTTAVPTMADIEAAEKKAFRPWLKDAWECEQQAIELVQQCQKIAANEGLSWAVGIMRARPASGDGLHVYVFAVVHATDGRFADRDVRFYDATARRWVGVEAFSGVDFTLI